MIVETLTIFALPSSNQNWQLMSLNVLLKFGPSALILTTFLLSLVSRYAFSKLTLPLEVSSTCQMTLSTRTSIGFFKFVQLNSSTLSLLLLFNLFNCNIETVKRTDTSSNIRLLDSIAEELLTNGEEKIARKAEK
jgi:hypothetical protein